MSAGPSSTRSANADILLKLLNEPQSGLLMAWFIMMAIEDYAERVIAAGPQGLKNPIVRPEDLIECAHEAKDAMSEWQI